jgi:tetratricopeptide (TPR) repeat protein
MEAVEHGEIASLVPLATIYFHRKDFQTAEQYIVRAVQANIFEAYLNMGILQERKGDIKTAEEYYHKALEKKIDFAWISLGNLEMNRPKPNLKKAKQFFEKALAAKIPSSGYYLGKIYLENTSTEKKGLELLAKEVVKKNSEAAHVLGHYYANRSEFEQSEKYFLEALTLGRTSALMCLTTSLLIKGRKERRGFALALMEKHLKDLQALGADAMIDYAAVLLWNNKIEQSLDIIRKQFKNIKEVFNQEDEEGIDEIIASLTQYMVLLIAKGQFKAAYSLFSDTNIDLRQSVKPVYYALMNHMKDEFPKEYLKAGEELKETVEEIMAVIESFRAKVI